MEMKNFTGGESQQTIAELYCSVEFTGEVHGELVFLSVINTFLSITAFLGNALILVALHKDINNMVTVLPISFKITIPRLSFIFHQIQIQNVSQT